MKVTKVELARAKNQAGAEPIVIKCDLKNSAFTTDDKICNMLRMIFDRKTLAPSFFSMSNGVIRLVYLLYEENECLKKICADELRKRADLLCENSFCSSIDKYELFDLISNGAKCFKYDFYGTAADKYDHKGYIQYSLAKMAKALRPPP